MGKNWTARGTAGHESHGQWAVYDDAGKDVAIVYDGPRDGNLIAAAPDLLAACKARAEVRRYYEFEFLPTIVAQALVEWFPAHFGGLTLPITPEAAMERIDRAEEAAIRKAEGGGE